MGDGHIRAVVERFGNAWGAHDLDAAMALVTDDIVFESTGPAPDGVRHEGKDAVRAAWQPIFDDAASSFEVEETFCLHDEHMVQTWVYRWDGGHVRGVDLFIVSHGLVAEKRSYVKG